MVGGVFSPDGKGVGGADDRRRSTKAQAILDAAIAGRAFPGAAAEVGTASGPIWQCVRGSLSFDHASPLVSSETLFDLASLTKPIATLSVILDLAEHRRLAIDDAVAAHIPRWQGPERSAVTLRDLLEHSAGLPARLLDRAPETRIEFEQDICATPLEYQPRTRAVYSDLGFILLGLIAEHAAGVSLGVQFERIRRRLCPDAHLEMPVADRAHRARSAPTRPLLEDVRRGRLLQGEVHDNYAAALGGEAGHAGLFGTAGGVGQFARTLLRAASGDGSLSAPATPTLLTLATTRTRVPGSSRAFAWDTMLITSSCGTHMSSAAFGHVGFTGTSLWIDPLAGRYFVLLTNRACDGGTLDDMRTVRRAFHEAWTAPID